MSLRRDVIRLASTHPEFRDRLLPLLEREASEERLPVSAEAIQHSAYYFAGAAHSRGERWHAGSSTTYPRKWYARLEEQFGPLDAIALRWFNDCFDHMLAQLTEERELPAPKPPSGLAKRASTLRSDIIALRREAERAADVEQAALCTFALRDRPLSKREKAALLDRWGSEVDLHDEDLRRVAWEECEHAAWVAQQQG